MYNRYLRGRDGNYVCQRVDTPAPSAPPEPEPERQTAQTAHQSAPQPGGLPALFGRRDLDTDDLLIAAILVLLLRDGDGLDWTSLLAGFLYLFL